MGHIVVGVDESAGAAGALRWAVRESDARDWSLTAVLAWDFIDQHCATGEKRFDPSYSEADAQAALNAIVAGAVGTRRAATIELRVVLDLAASALLDASDGADLLVVGARGLGGFRALLLGSVSQQCLHHATCPVAIVREAHDFGEPVARIVVGIDGSETAYRAFQWAVDAGRVYQASVEVVHAWGVLLTAAEPFGPVMFDVAPLADAARHMLDAVVESADTSGLPAPVTRTLSSGNAAASILHAAERADLVVVGSRGLGGFKGLVLGSVSHHIAHHAMCPVVVVPPTAASLPA